MSRDESIKAINAAIKKAIEERPDELTEQLHPDELKILLRAFAYMCLCHPDVSKKIASDIADDVTAMLYFNEDMDEEIFEEILPRSELIEYCRNIIRLFVSCDPDLAVMGTVFSKDSQNPIL